MLLIPELAQAVLVGAATHASGSGGGPQADPPLVTSGTAGCACGTRSVVSLLIGGLHRAHRPLSHHGNSSLQASSAAFRPSVYRL